LKVSDAIERIDALVKNPSAGLPKDVFLLLSRLTPLVNVDLLIKDARGRTLLTWRDDDCWPPGWHIPGGIIRYKESALDRLQKTSRNELGTGLKPAPEFLAHKEFLIPHLKTRGHFISLLYKCALARKPDPARMFRRGKPKPGQWAWHDGCPADLLKGHEVYRGYI